MVRLPLNIIVCHYRGLARALITVNFGDLEIPDIVLDTGFSVDGLMICNPDYRDSLDLANAIDVSIGGAGSGGASNAGMIDSADYDIGDVTMVNHRVIVLQDDTYEGFPSNGIMVNNVFRGEV